MPKNTRLSGHGLRSEGKPFNWSSESGRWIRADTPYGANTGDGVALCSCGEASQVLHNNAERKRWHAVHKRQMREQATSRTEENRSDG